MWYFLIYLVIIFGIIVFDIIIFLLQSPEYGIYNGYIIKHHIPVKSIYNPSYVVDNLGNEISITREIWVDKSKVVINGVEKTVPNNSSNLTFDPNEQLYRWNNPCLNNETFLALTLHTQSYYYQTANDKSKVENSAGSYRPYFQCIDGVPELKLCDHGQTFSLTLKKHVSILIIYVKTNPSTIIMTRIII